MKSALIFSTLFIVSILSSHCQSSEKITSLDFVQVQNNNLDEAIFYYQNNWLVLRKMAIKQNMIDAFQLLQTTSDTASPFEIVLITTYANQDQFDQREENFSRLIKERGSLQLLNEKQPSEFRKVIFSKEQAIHLSK
ncbi:MAG: hypothetical protein JXQ90_17225 [Cyclobacteriaceae bacterium]